MWVFGPFADQDTRNLYRDVTPQQTFVDQAVFRSGSSQPTCSRRNRSSIFTISDDDDDVNNGHRSHISQSTDDVLSPLPTTSLPGRMGSESVFFPRTPSGSYDGMPQSRNASGNTSPRTRSRRGSTLHAAVLCARNIDRISSSNDEENAVGDAWDGGDRHGSEAGTENYAFHRSSSGSGRRTRTSGASREGKGRRNRDSAASPPTSPQPRNQRNQPAALQEVLRMHREGTHFRGMDVGKIHQMHMIFDLCDADQSESIGAEEFAHIITDKSLTGLDFDVDHMSPSLISRIFDSFDTDGSGELDFNEFLQAFDGAVSQDGSADTSKVFAAAHHLALVNETQSQQEMIANMESIHMRELDKQKQARQEMDAQLESQTEMFEESLDQSEHAVNELRRKLEHSEESRLALAEQVEDYAKEIEELKIANARLVRQSQNTSMDNASDDGDHSHGSESPNRREQRKRDAEELDAAHEELERLRQNAINAEEELEAMLIEVGDLQDENDLLRADNAILQRGDTPATSPISAAVDDAQRIPLQGMLTQACNELADAKVEIATLVATVADLENEAAISAAVAKRASPRTAVQMASETEPAAQEVLSSASLVTAAAGSGRRSELGVFGRKAQLVEHPVAAKAEIAILTAKVAELEGNAAADKPCLLQDMLDQTRSQLTSAKVEISALKSQISQLRAVAAAAAAAAAVIKPPQLADEEEWLRLNAANSALTRNLQAAQDAVVEMGTKHESEVAVLNAQVASLEANVAILTSRTTLQDRAREELLQEHQKTVRAMQDEINTLKSLIIEIEGEKEAEAEAARRDAATGSEERARLANRIAELQSGADMQGKASPTRRKSSAEISLASDHSWEQAERQRLEGELADALKELEKIRQERLEALSKLSGAEGSKVAANAAAERQQAEKQNKVVKLAAANAELEKQLADRSASLHDCELEVKTLTEELIVLKTQIVLDKDTRALMEAKLQEACRALALSLKTMEETKEATTTTKHDVNVSSSIPAFSAEDQLKFDRMVRALNEALGCLQAAEEALAKCEAENSTMRVDKTRIESELTEATSNAQKWQSTAGEYKGEVERLQTELDRATDEVSRLRSAMPRSGRIVDGDMHDDMIAARDGQIKQLLDELNEARRDLKYALESIPQPDANSSTVESTVELETATLIDGVFASSEIEALKAERDAATARENMCQTELDSLRTRRGASAAAAYETLQAETERLQERIIELEDLLRESNSDEKRVESDSKDELIQALVAEISILKRQLQHAVDGKYAALERGYSMAARGERSTVQNEVVMNGRSRSGVGGGGNAFRNPNSNRRFVRRTTHVPVSQESQDSYRYSRGRSDNGGGNGGSGPKVAKSPVSRRNFFVRVGTTPAAQKFGLAQCDMWIRVDGSDVHLITPDGTSCAAWPLSCIANIQLDGNSKKAVKFDVVQAADPPLSTGGPTPPESRDTFEFTGRNQEVADALKSALLHFGAQHHSIAGVTSN